MPRKPRSITAPDDTGFTVRPGAKKKAFQPSSELLGLKPLHHSKARAEPAPTTIVRPDDLPESKKTADPTQYNQTETPIYRKNHNKAEFVQIAFFLDQMNEQYISIQELCAAHGILEHDVFKMIAKRVRLLSKEQNPERTPEKFEPIGEIRHRAKIAVPNTYIENYRSRYDPVGILPLAEIGASWIKPILSLAIEQCVVELSNRLK